jgi:hypothetical protein
MKTEVEIREKLFEYLDNMYSYVRLYRENPSDSFLTWAIEWEYQARTLLWVLDDDGKNINWPVFT